MTSEEIFNKLRDMLPNLRWKLTTSNPECHYVEGFDPSAPSDGAPTVEVAVWGEGSFKGQVDIQFWTSISDGPADEALAHVATVQKLLSPTRAE